MKLILIFTDKKAADFCTITKSAAFFIYVSNESSPCLNETVILYFRKPIRFLYFAISFSTALKSDIRHCQFGLPAFPGVFIFQYIHPGSKFSSLFPVHFHFLPEFLHRKDRHNGYKGNCSVPSQAHEPKCIKITFGDGILLIIWDFDIFMSKHLAGQWLLNSYIFLYYFFQNGMSDRSFRHIHIKVFCDRSTNDSKCVLAFQFSSVFHLFRIGNKRNIFSRMV